MKLTVKKKEVLIEKKHVCRDKTRHYPQNPFYSSVTNTQESEEEQYLYKSIERERGYM